MRKFVLAIALCMSSSIFAETLSKLVIFACIPKDAVFSHVGVVQNYPNVEWDEQTQAFVVPAEQLVNWTRAFAATHFFAIHAGSTTGEYFAVASPGEIEQRRSTRERFASYRGFIAPFENRFSLSSNTERDRHPPCLNFETGDMTHPSSAPMRCSTAIRSSL